MTDRLAAQVCHPQILPYSDVLHRMCRTVKCMRTAMPDVAICTTFLVGHPGEIEAEFQSLLDFGRDGVRPWPYQSKAGQPVTDL
ncbi:MAG: hypothetical protein V3S14_17850 [Anaerolineae bacterium]